MTLPGLTGVLAGIAPATGYAATMTVGSADVVVGFDPKGGGDIHSVAVGMAVADPVYGTFGSIDVANYQGYPIAAMYQKDTEGVTHLTLTGDAHTLSPVLKVNTVNQNLGAGTFAAGVTTFAGTAADPFTGHATRAITITP